MSISFFARCFESASAVPICTDNHCPICAAATACTGPCAKELEVFQAILGDDTHIQRVEHIIAGERRCAYQVIPH